MLTECGCRTGTCASLKSALSLHSSFLQSFFFIASKSRNRATEQIWISLLFSGRDPLALTLADGRSILPTRGLSALLTPHKAHLKHNQSEMQENRRNQNAGLFFYSFPLIRYIFVFSMTCSRELLFSFFFFFFLLCALIILVWLCLLYSTW